MAFLNPIFLWAAFAVAIPIIVHLFNFRRPKKVLFSNIALVKEVKQTVVRRLRLKQWLVLASRILAILALVFLFADPVLISESGSGMVAGNNSVAIVVDDSYSMKAGNERGAYHLQAKKLADEIIKGHSRQDEFLVMSTSDLRLNNSFWDNEDAKEAVSRLEIKQNVLRTGELLNLIPDLFRKAANPRHNLYFISDFQRSTVLTDSLVRYPADSGLFVNFIPLSTRNQKNVYLAKHEIVTRIIEPGRPLTLKLTLVNDGEEEVKDLSIRVLVEDKAVAISNESLKAGEMKDVEISFSPPGTGWRSGYIEIDDYPVEFDNRRFFSFYIPENERVLVVEGETSEPVRLVYNELLTQFSPEFISYKKFSTARLEEYKFVILLGINEISTGMEEQLKLHLNEGKSIMLFPGGNMKKESVNRFLRGIKIGEFGEEIKSKSGLLASQVDLQHPVFGDIFRKGSRKGRFDGPEVYRYFNFKPDNSVVQNPIIQMPNGDPFLLETKTDEGQFFLFSVFPGDSWTNFHYKGIFAPLMLRLSLLMNQTQNLQQNQELGFFKVKRIKTKENDPIRLVNKDGLEHSIDPVAKGGFALLRFDMLDLDEGNYDLVQKDNLLEKISFNVPDAESQLKSLNKSALIEYLQQIGLDKIAVTDPSPDGIASEIQYQKEGIPLWKYFLIAAILFLLVEVALLRFWESA